MRRSQLTRWLLACAAVAGCNAGSTSVVKIECDPGEADICRGDACIGERVCDDDGAWGECRCAADTAASSSAQGATASATGGGSDASGGTTALAVGGNAGEATSSAGNGGVAGSGAASGATGNSGGSGGNGATGSGGGGGSSGGSTADGGASSTGGGTTQTATGEVPSTTGDATGTTGATTGSTTSGTGGVAALTTTQTSSTTGAGGTGVTQLPCDQPRTPAINADPGNSGAFDTVEAVCYRLDLVPGQFAAWGCSNLGERTVMVNDVPVECGEMPLPAPVDGSYFFEFSAGPVYSSFFWYNWE